jgi:hypothetical protein
MLKLERKEGGLSIGLRDKERWFSAHFIVGLAAALFLHGSALLLFDIQSFRTHHSKSPPPAMVETDLTSINEISDQEIYVQWEEEKKRRRNPLMPLASTPKLQKTLLPAAELYSVALPILTDNSFDQIEKAERILEDQEPLLIHATSIQLSGGLAGRKINWTPPEPQVFDPSLRSMRYLAEVQVDESTGAIFWWHPISIEGELNLVDQAEKLLADLSLLASGRHGVSRGIVEITVVNQ